jgi:NADPH-dependent F420 reductase
MVIGFIGGTGPEGKGLALRFALAGEDVLIGSRDETRAAEAAAELSALADGRSIGGGLNEDVASRSEIVFVVVPYSGHKPTLEALRERLTGKIVVDVVAPMEFSKGVARAVPVPEGSAALQAKALLPDSIIAAAFQTISARDLMNTDQPVESDVVVCGQSREARQTVMALAEKVPGVRAVDGGGLSNAGYVENLTPLLVNINRRYKAHSAIKIVGI